MCCLLVPVQQVGKEYLCEEEGGNKGREKERKDPRLNHKSVVASAAQPTSKTDVFAGALPTGDVMASDHAVVDGCIQVAELQR